ncbi:protein FAR1-RELATED SEQUENCE 5-like [Bidens hawaiensis]|uniref:protein FAR1-RELATED SEQUENCE 5-like n=1 Tax=Bidens hawaiensis TaxID=980011 RepID=UPI00404B4A1F
MSLEPVPTVKYVFQWYYLVELAILGMNRNQNKYAEKAGFCTRLGTTKKRNDIITTRYILCLKANKPKDQDVDSVGMCSTSSSRCVNFKVTDCNAFIKIRLVRGSSDYEIYGFMEEHNHGPLSSKHITKRKRILDFATKEFISNCRLACVGPTKAFKLHVVLKGGHHNLQGTLTDYNNFGKDIRELIADGDAQMVVDKFNERAKNVKNFTFKSRVFGTELTSLFWVDNISKINYEAFGDVMAFDATYHTNMYDMILVSFTGIDHHKKCIVFGAGLLHNESVESYTWLLQMFLDTHGKQPTFGLTDQDPSIKQAVHSVLDKSIHRLCMWHVITKLPLKVTFDTSNFTVTCECMGFTSIGYLCRHVFCIYRHQGIDKIPMKYVSLRWCRDALPSGVYCMENRYCAYLTRSSIIRRRISDNIQMCIDRLRCNARYLEELDLQIKAIKEKIFEEFPLEPTYSKEVVIEELLSHKKPIKILITTPNGIQNKGSRKTKRPIGPSEKAKKKSKKKGKKKSRRKCNFCNKRVRLHDKRNCPQKLGIPDEETGDTSTEEDTDEDTDEISKEGTYGESNGKETDKDI